MCKNNLRQEPRWPPPYPKRRLGSYTTPRDTIGDRAQAEADYSAAIVARNNGHVDVAIWRFASSYEIWRRIGYRWRAAAAAIDLGELTGDRAISAYARQEATVFPQSWLVRQIARSEKQAT